MDAQFVFEGFRFTAGLSNTIAEVSEPGDVRIDWDAVDAVLADPKNSGSLLVYARLMRACRDGAWKPLGGGEESSVAAFRRYEDDGDPWNSGYICCFDKMMPAIGRLQAALSKEWEMNHHERCGNMNDCTSFGGKRPCQHERPKPLGAKGEET